MMKYNDIVNLLSNKKPRYDSSENLEKIWSLNNDRNVNDVTAQNFTKYLEGWNWCFNSIIYELYYCDCCLYINFYFLGNKILTNVCILHCDFFFFRPRDISLNSIHRKTRKSEKYLLHHIRNKNDNVKIEKENKDNLDLNEEK